MTAAVRRCATATWACCSHSGIASASCEGKGKHSGVERRVCFIEMTSAADARRRVEHPCSPGRFGG